MAINNAGRSWLHVIIGCVVIVDENLVSDILNTGALPPAHDASLLMVGRVDPENGRTGNAQN